MTRNTIILDLETAHSADDCCQCGMPAEAHGLDNRCDTPTLRTIGARYTRLGWDNKAALGLSIGCYWASIDQRCHFFDVYTLEATVRSFVEQQPLLVSFNGIAFDFPLMRGLLRAHADRVRQGDTSDSLFTGTRGEDITVDHAADLAQGLMDLCDAFKTLCAQSYDLLQAVWAVDPTRKFEPGLNSLDALSQANGLGIKLSHGAQAPRDWRDGRYAQVINYCQDDVYKTKALFEMVCEGTPLLRGNGKPIVLPPPAKE